MRQRTNDTDNRSMGLWPNAPDMEVGNSCVSRPFDAFADFRDQMRISSIEPAV